jgi:hypothetical protein
MKFTLRIAAKLGVVAVAAGSVVLPQLQADAAAPTGVAIIGCSTAITGVENVAGRAPFEISVTADPAVSSANPGDTVFLTGTVKLTVGGLLVKNFKTQASATKIGVTNETINLAVTGNATPSVLTLTDLGTLPQQTFVTDNSDPSGYKSLVFTWTNVNLGSIKTSGANGDVIKLAIATDDANTALDGIMLSGDGIFTAAPQYLGFGVYGQTDTKACANNTDGKSGANQAYDPSVISPEIASITLGSTGSISAPKSPAKLTGTIAAGKHVVSGKVTAAGKGVVGLKLTLKSQVKGKWKTVATLKTTTKGAYKSGKLKKGTYKVVAAKQTVKGVTYAAWNSKAVKVK